jgi:dienelactone hydrolase
MAGTIGRALACLVLAASAATCGALSSSPGASDLTPDATANPPDPSVVAARRSAGIPLFADSAGTDVADNITPDGADSTATATVSDVLYVGADGRVTGLLVEPAAGDLQPAVIMLGGLPGTRRDLLPRALDLANAGVISLLIDAPFARAQRIGPGTQPLNFTDQDRAEQIQLVVDLRRAMDLLVARPGVDQNAIGFLGSSYGASIGGLFAGVEPRLAASVLESGDGGLVSHFAALGDASPLAALTPAARDAWIAAMDPIEPVYFVGNATGPVLFQAGTQDTVTTPIEAAGFAAAGNAQSSRSWYDSGHGLSEPAWCDAAKFLGDHLGFDGSAVTACGTAPAKPDTYSWVAIIGLFVVMIVVRLLVRMRRRRPPPPPDADDDLGDGSTPPIIKVGTERG